MAGRPQQVHKAVIGHCTKMADLARNRIGIASATVSENGIPLSILDHANDVRSDHFILAAPAGAEAPLAGLLDPQFYFRIPHFQARHRP